MDKYPRELFIYMDDILIATTDDLLHHHQIVHEVLDLMEFESYFLKPSKCSFEQSNMEYLGIVVSGDSLTIDLAKIEGISHWPRNLKNLKQVHSTLGVLGYQCPFIQDYATLARPLTNLLKKDVPFLWSDTCRAALNKLIAIVTSRPALCQPDPTLPFSLEVDTSAYAVGAILTQKDDRGKHQAVGYFSKTFTEAERNYDVHDHELLAVVRGLANWHHLLAGSPHPITVYTDHKNLQYYRNPQHISRHVAHYIPLLEDYNYTLIHKPGISNHADALSCHPDFDDGTRDSDHILVLPPHLFIDVITTATLEDRVPAY